MRTRSMVYLLLAAVAIVLAAHVLRPHGHGLLAGLLPALHGGR